jgi:glycosyltransferase involved in cell wall biosynthesis
MAKLSVTIITFNEEKNIDRCIQSATKVADEIVVVDSLSSDRTKEICLSHQVVFIENPFAGHIEQKKFAASKSAHDHILNIDADEALSDELAASIMKEKENGFPADGYTMNRLNYYCGKWIRHGTFYPDKKLRLFNVKKTEYGGYNPHDRVILQVGSVAKHLKGDLLHFTYQSFEEHLEKIKYFSTIAAKSLNKRGRPSSYFRVLMSPVWSFFHSYILKLGLLDGKEGFMIAKLTAKHSFLKYRSLARLNRQRPDDNG